MFGRLVERKNCLLVQDDWINAFLEWAEAFPESEHDDQVDNSSKSLLDVDGT